MRRPFYWAKRQCWYVKGPNRKNIRLDPDEKTALKLWAEMAAVESPESPGSPFAAIAEAFLDWAAANVTPKTYRGYSDFLVSFCGLYGLTRTRDLKPYHVTRWLAKNPTWKSSDTQRGAIAALKRCCNWAVEQGLLVASPFVSVKKPQGNRRDVLIDDSQHAAMVLCGDKGHGAESRRDLAFRPVLIALRHSGTRPGMVASVRVENVSADGSTWVMGQHKTRKKTGKPLVVYLSPCLATLTRIAAAGRTEGPLFLNSRGKAWTVNAIRCRMRGLRKKLKLPAGTVAYSFRHSFTTNALMNGTDLASVAELLGHSDLKMLAKHYGHLDKQADHLKAAAAKAVRRKG